MEDSRPGVPGADLLGGEPDWDRMTKLQPSRVLLTVLSVILLIALLGWLLPRALDTSWGTIASVLGSLPLWLLPTVLVLALAAMVCEAVSMHAALPGARFGTAVQAQWTAGAISVAVPGGSLIGLGAMGLILHRRGVRTRNILTGVATVGAVDILISGILIPLLGVISYAALSLRYDLPGTVGAVIIAGLGIGVSIALLILFLRRQTFARLLSRLQQALPVEDAQEICDGILDLRDQVTARLRTRALRLLGPVLLARVLQFAVLALGLVALGAHLGLWSVAAVFLIGRALALLPVTPGGSGITETAVAALLVVFAVPAADGAAAALVLSVATVLVPVILGGIVGTFALTGRRQRAA